MQQTISKHISTISVFTVLCLVFTLWSRQVSPVKAAADGYWRTEGGRIVDTNGQTVKFAGVNWFGLETGTFAPHGLWARGYKEMMDQMKQLGFNAIRLPYSNQMLNASSRPNGIDYSKNIDLQGLTALEIMDKVVAYAGQIGMKVILDQHRPDSNGQSSLWYSGSLSEDKWISDWKFLAQRYANNPTVVGMDLHNEPHQEACWGCGDTGRDWKIAAEKAGNAILAVNPNVLIIVEGVETIDNNWYWWGGNLRGVKDIQVNLSVPNRVVYSTHDYPSTVNPQAWFSDSNYPNNLPAHWDATWGYIQKNNIAPVLVGEFGTKLETQSDVQWFETMVKYLNDNQFSWTFWSWNPNSGDTGGILQDDWNTVNEGKMKLLRTIQAPGAVTVNPAPPQPTPTSIPAPAPAPTLTPIANGVKATISPTTPQVNQPASLNVTAGLTNPMTDAVIDVEIFNRQGDRVQQSFFENQNLSQPVALTIPVNLTKADIYRVAVGIFQANWSGLSLWENELLTFTVAEGIQQPRPSPTSTPTPAPSPTPRPRPTAAPAPSSTPMPTGSPAPTPGSNALSVWWPDHRVPVNGNQPFKVQLPNKPVSEYKLYWQVDGGQFNEMGDSFQAAPHKEQMVDLSGWNWRGNGPYQITFVAKDLQGKEISKTSVDLSIDP